MFIMKINPIELNYCTYMANLKSDGGKIDLRS